MTTSLKTLHAKKIITLMFTAYLVLIANLSLNAQVCFSPKTSYTTGINPISICYADFNADGKMDLATANNSAGVGEISVLLGNGIGGFGAASSFAVGIIPRSVCTGDFNNDGKPDLATANIGPGSVSILLGNGLGGFTVGTDFTTGIFNSSSTISSADFNADGNDDLIITSGANFVLIALSNGNGSFATATSVAVNNGTHSVVISDFNGDSKLDLAVTTYNGSNFVSILLGNGMGGFGIPANFSIGNSLASLISADFNGDGNIDLASANTDNNITGSVSILLGNGTGSFSAFTNFSVGTSVVPKFLCSADFDGDGNLDLAASSIANNNSGNLTILTGNGAGSFSTPVNFPVDSFPNAIITSDFNADGKMDIATSTTQSNIDSGKVSVLLNCNTTGINQLESVGDLLIIYPNPSTELTTIRFSKNTNALITIQDIIGKKFLEVPIKNQEQITIPVSDLPRGIYFVKITENNKSIIKKIILM